MEGKLVVPLVAPVIAWILASIVGYAVKRYNLARILYVDVDYRLRFEILAVYRLQEQIKKLREWSSADFPTTHLPPSIRMVKEEQFVLPSIQGDLKCCLWGNEIDAVRNFYRDFQLVEHRAGKVEDLYSDLVKKHVECSTPKPSHLRNYPRCYVEQIDDQFKIIKEIVEFWIRTLGEDHNFKFGAAPDPNFRSKFPKAAEKLIYGRILWHLTFVVIPFLAIAGAFGVLFLAVFYIGLKKLTGFLAEDGCLSLFVDSATIAMLILPFYLKSRGDRAIQECVLKVFDDRLQRKLDGLWTPSTQQAL